VIFGPWPSSGSPGRSGFVRLAPAGAWGSAPLDQAEAGSLRPLHQAAPRPAAAAQERREYARPTRQPGKRKSRHHLVEGNTLGPVVPATIPGACGMTPLSSASSRLTAAQHRLGPHPTLLRSPAHRWRSRRSRRNDTNQGWRACAHLERSAPGCHSIGDRLLHPAEIHVLGVLLAAKPPAEHQVQQSGQARQPLIDDQGTTCAQPEQPANQTLPDRAACR